MYNNHKSKFVKTLICFLLFISLLTPFSSVVTQAEEKARQLLITEIAPNIKGDEDYEYFEVYNASDKELTLKDYKFYYVYTDGSGSDILLTLPDYTLQPSETIVLWYNRVGRTKEEFKSHYGTTLSDTSIMEFTGQKFNGMANTGNRGIKITDNSNQVISFASYLGDEVGEDLVKHFKALENSYEMGSFQTKAVPTPGIVQIEQIQIQQSGENKAPVISHQPVASIDDNQNLNITATIHAEQDSITATLHYQTNEKMEWKSKPLIRNGDDSYTAEIPQEDYLGSKVKYYLEVKDGTNAVTYPENISTSIEVAVNKQQSIDTQQMPKLLVTELTPDTVNVNKKDGYEFIEIYNNTDEEINIKDYQIIYRYPDSTPQQNWDLTEDKIVPSKGSIVVWIKNGANGNSTITDFNHNYGTSLDETRITTVSSDGMANGSERTIVIADDFGTEISQATYNNGSADVFENKGIIYKHPLSGNKMIKVGLSNKANPGEILEGQVPNIPVTLSGDANPPVISHSQVESFISDKDLVIKAQVTDDTKVQSVSLYYRSPEETQWKSTAMNLVDESTNTYEGIISKDHLRTEKIIYKIEASDGKNTAKTEDFTVNITKPEYDVQKIPPFLITEVVPDSTNVNGLDGYEFIEIYNHTNKDINFKDYKIRYRYPMEGPEADLIWAPEKEDIIIPSGETFVFWIINKGNRDKTVADFNKHYQVQLEEYKNIVKIYSDGMANTGGRGIIVATNTGHEVVTSFYNDEPNKKDTAPDKGIFYVYPTNGSKQMVKISSAKETATPGTIKENQVPATRVELSEDLKDPALEDLSNVSEVNEKENLSLLFDAQDDMEVKTVRLFYKNNEQKSYRSVDLLQDYNDDLFHYTIYSPEMIGKKSIEYYVIVSDGTNQIESEKRTVKITGNEVETGLRLNLNEGSVIRGETVIKATSTPEGYENITLKIDDKEVTHETYKVIEKQAYFAFDVKKTNLYFKNGVTMGDKILHIFDDTINQYATITVPIEPDQIQYDGKTVISIRSGTKVSPFDQESEENRDDFYVKNIRMVLSDGTVIYDPKYSDQEKEWTVGDGASAQPTIDFSFEVPKEKFLSKAYKWDTRNTTEGPHTISAIEGQEKVTAKVIVDNSAPAITPSIEEGKEYKGPFTIDALVEDKWSGVTKVSAKLDGKEMSLPYETSSAKLEPGSHTFEVTATDLVGNEGKQTVHFTVVEEHPFKPKVLSPLDGAKDINKNAKLSVEVHDPTNDDLQVQFYEGYKYKPTDANIKVFANSTETEPPQQIEPDGETPLTGEELAKLDSKDGAYVTTTSIEKFPYHRFEAEVDSSVDENDIIQLQWEGKSLLGRKLSMYVWNYSTNKWEIQQWKVAGDEDVVLTASVKGLDYVKNRKIQVLVQDEITKETPFDYTLVWMSDTQYYSESYPHIYKKMVDWIAENKESLNIPYVFHTGDIVDKAYDDQQWAYADEYMRVLENANIPYGVLAGNHDVDHKTNDYTQYYKYFGEKRFKDKPYYGESYKNNRGHYDLISVNGNDYIMVYMGWGIEDEDIAWVKDVLAKYPDRMAFLNFHEYLLVSGNRSPIGDKIYKEVVLQSPNVVAVLSGHYHDSELLIDEIDDNGDGTPDRKVYQMLADYQGGPEGGQGYMRLLHVNPSENKIYVKTYSPYLDDYNFYDPETYPGKDEFVIDLPLEPKEKEVSTDRFEVKVYTDKRIDEAKKVKNGNKAEADWKNLKDDQQYGWYVKVTDDYGGETISEVWTFTTGKSGGSSNDKIYNLVGFSTKKLTIQATNALINMDSTSVIRDGIWLKNSATVKGEGLKNTNIVISPTSKDAVIDLSGAEVKEVIIDNANVKEIRGAENVQLWTITDGVDTSNIIFKDSKGEVIAPLPLPSLLKSSA